MQQSIVDANAKVDQVRQILNNYVQNKGSLNTLMHKVRDQLAQIYPALAPEFLYHLSKLARTDIAKDVRRGRHTYPMGVYCQILTPWKEIHPSILPGKAIFHDSKEAFRRALGKDWNSSCSGFRRDFHTTEPIPPTATLVPESKPTIVPTHLDLPLLEKICVNKIPTQYVRRSHPRFTTPPQNSYTRHAKFVSSAARYN